MGGDGNIDSGGEGGCWSVYFLFSEILTCYNLGYNELDRSEDYLLDLLVLVW